MKTEQDKDIQISGMTGFFQVVRTFGNPQAPENLREDTLQHKWTLNSGSRIIQIAGQCRASKAPEFAKIRRGRADFEVSVDHRKDRVG